jgi:predicted nucleic acid-binding protein
LGPTVANSGPLIALARLDLLHLFPALYGEIIIPQAVHDEILAGVSGARELSEAAWLHVRQPSDPDLVERLSAWVERGEAEAIALAIELSATLLVDDRRARQVATRSRVPLESSVVLLALARDRGLIGAVAPLIDELVRANYSLSKELVRAARRLAEREA